ADYRVVVQDSTWFDKHPDFTFLNRQKNLGILSTDQNGYHRLLADTSVISVKRNLQSPNAGRDNVFPHNTLDWSPDQFGPIVIPEKGATIKLSEVNIKLYERIIEVYEHNELTAFDDGTFAINGKKTEAYTFQMNYYFAIGDNWNNSFDSRYWGFVPEDHIIGRAFLVWFSAEPDEHNLRAIRWERLFRPVGCL
ncbi:MAG: hypothetical protein RIS47_1366, partial [Bacteroidota bacterium]